MRLIQSAIVFLVLTLPGAVRSETIFFEASAGIDKPIGMQEPPLSGSLSLKGSRGETLNFLIKTRVSGCERLELKLPGIDAGSLTLRLFDVETIATRRASFPGAYVGRHYDPLLPNEALMVCGSGEPSWKLGELVIPRSAARGSYQGELLLGSKSIAFSLRIWKMTIPLRPALPCYSELTTWFNLLGHYGMWVDQEPELAALYVREMNDHRIYPLKSAIDMPALIVLRGAPALDIWNSPDSRQAFFPVTLAERPEWAYFDFPTISWRKFNTPRAAQYFEAVQNTIPDTGRKGKAIVYLWDEPPPKKIGLLKEYTRMVKRLAPSLKIMVTVPYRSDLADSIDIFVPVMNHFNRPGLASAADYRRAQRQGKEVWWYVSCMSHGCSRAQSPGTPDFVIDRPSSYIRSAGWISAKHNIDAFLYYSVNNGYQFYPNRDPWDSLWDFSGNGDGTLFYPGRPGERGLQQHVPIPSLRLKLWRESSYDVEYVRWMKALKRRAPKWWRSGFRRLVRSTTNWNKDYSKYRELRERAGDYLDGL